MSWDKERIAQIQLPDPADDDPHPRLLLEGRGIHAGQGFTALFPDGWHEITLEVAWEPTGPGCWIVPAWRACAARAVSCAASNAVLHSASLAFNSLICSSFTASCACSVSTVVCKTPTKSQTSWFAVCDWLAFVVCDLVCDCSSLTEFSVTISCCLFF